MRARVLVMGVAYGLIFVPAIEAARRGAFLSTSGAFTISSGDGRGNRAGNDELKEDAELREAMRDEDLYPIEDDRETYLDLVEEAEGESARAVKHQKHIKELTSKGPVGGASLPTIVGRWAGVFSRL